ncbi:MAG: RNA-directed DNA polymerase [SAR324 cluster bacterium]|nr:RNA-directed DNA polymerase [SAR324 cluster bacterium]
MKRFGNLWTSIVSFENLRIAALEASISKRGSIPVQNFLFNLEPNVLQLQSTLESGQYQPGNYSYFKIYEPKERNICAAPFVDRVVHHAVCRKMNPLLERVYVPQSFACRTGMGMHKAVNKAQEYLRISKYFLKCDVEKFFDSVDHEILKGRLMRKFKDERLLDLLNKIIDHPVPGNPLGRGLPIGNLTSQHFANFLLTGLDVMILEEIKPKGYIRYMDDFVLFSDDKSDLHTAKQRIKNCLMDKMRLNLKQRGCFVAPGSHGLPFLGFQIFPAVRRLKRANWIRFTQKFKQKYATFQTWKIDEATLIRSTASLFGHVRHADSLNLRRNFCESFVWH